MPSTDALMFLPSTGRQRSVLDRRMALYELLSQENYLTRAALIARVEAQLGTRCFGSAAWEDNFYRDMRAVKQAFEDQGETLCYSRTSGRKGYYLQGRQPLTPEIVREITGAIAELDRRQLDIYRRLTPAQRFEQGRSITDLAHRAARHRKTAAHD